MDPMEAIRAGRSGWRSQLEEAVRAGSPGPTRRILAAHPRHEALMYIEARGLLAKLVKEAGGTAGALDTIQQLLAFGVSVDLSADPVYRQALIQSGCSDSNGRWSTPMNWAACLGYTQLVDVLLEAGAETEKKNGRGCTPLFMAACNGHRECCAALLRAGANPEAATLDGMGLTPITIAEQAGHMVIAEELREALAGQETSPDHQVWIAQALRLKDQGNAALKGGNMCAACKCYGAGLQHLEGGAAVGHGLVSGAEAKGLRVTLLSNRAEALLKITGHDVVVCRLAGNDCVAALELDPGHAKSQRRLQRADNLETRVEKANATSTHLEILSTVEKQLEKALNEGRRWEDGVEVMLRRGTTAAQKVIQPYMTCSIAYALNLKVRHMQLLRITGQFEPAEVLARATLALAVKLKEAADWPTPVYHPDVDDTYNKNYERDVLRAISGTQYSLAKCLTGQPSIGRTARGQEEALALYLDGIDGWSYLAVEDPALLSDAFMAQTDALDLQCQMENYQSAAETAAKLRAQIAEARQVCPPPGPSHTHTHHNHAHRRRRRRRRRHHHHLTRTPAFHHYGTAEIRLLSKCVLEWPVS